MKKRGKKAKYREYKDSDLLKLAKKYETRMDIYHKDRPLYVELNLRKESLKKAMSRSHLKRTRRTEEEIIKEARAYKTKRELYRNNWNLYQCLNARGLLDKACAHMKKSKNEKFYKKVPLYAKIVGEMFNYESFNEFSHTPAYQAALRHNINSLEIFENKDNVDYLKKLIKSMFTESISENQLSVEK
jgi:hypothetical protein